MRSLIRTVLAGAIVLGVGASDAALAADARNGERLAQRWCASCHLISPAQQQTTATEAAPFSAIARMPGFNEGMLALFLLSPHPRMPDMNLTRAEAADLAAYIGDMGRQ